MIPGFCLENPCIERRPLMALVPSLRGRFVLSAAVMASLLCVSFAAPASAAASTSQPAPAAAGWLARQMVDGERFEANFGGTLFPDQGLTIDALMAFAAVGVAGENAEKAMAWLAKPEIMSAYIGDGVAESYAGSTAKLMLIAQIAGQDPTAFGGADLETRLRALLTPSGRFSDTSAFGDFSNGFGQAFAMLALDRTSGGVPASAISFLTGTQCDDGGFETFYDDPATCTSDEDSTSMILQALVAAGGADDAVADGLAWLLDQQDDNGGFGGSGPTPQVNASSTGLAAQALRVLGQDAAADDAAAFLRGQQVGCQGAMADRGGIAYDADGFNTGNASRATAQALLGLTGVGLADLSLAEIEAEAPTLSCPNLPVTGQKITVYAAGGAVLVLLGVGVLLLTRRRRSGSA